MELTEYHKKSYGSWAGNPRGRKPDPTRCAEEVRSNERWPTYHQCSRKRGHGPKGAFCRQHDPDVVRARKEEVRRREAARWRRNMIEAYGSSFLKVLQRIADGHNDPRTLARETVDEFNRRYPGD